MDAVRLGRQLRARRQRRRWRQIDLAAAAHVSQSTIARLEADELRQMSVGTLEAVCGALGNRLEVRLQGGAELDRLLDAGHAAIVEEVVHRLTHWEWEVEAQMTFAVYG
jgi:transcriptional regulator with XRE-family HTH domain